MISLLTFTFLISLVGVILIKEVTSESRFEIILPSGFVLGHTIFVFILNLVSFFFKGSTGVVIAYGLTIFLGFVFLLKQRTKFSFPSISFDGKFLFFWLSSILVWGLFIFWKTSHVLIGSDTNLYYAVAHSFIKGNFPPVTPWQPDIPLSYHIGTSELLGAFYYLSGLDFQFLHLFFSALFIFCAAQIIIWIIRRHNTLISFLLYNLATAVTFISFGFIYITWPIFPIRLPVIESINQLVLWLRDLPTVNQAIEVYGAPINLDALIYFIFHAFGLSIFFSLLVLVLNLRKEKTMLGWIVICIGLAGLALVNESLFIAAFPAFFLGIFLVELKEKTLTKNLKKLLLLVAITVLVVFFQGGIISSSINSPKNLENSVILFPQKGDIKDDFQGYHLGQEASKLLPNKVEWLPLRWYHLGVDFLLVLSLIPVFVVKSEFYQSVLVKVLFVAGLFSLLAYNVIVPKFLVANGNRFLSVSFLFFSLLLCLSLIPIFKKIQKSLIKKIIFIIFVGWIFISTILPPLALLSKNRFGENKLIPKSLQSSQGILWLKDNANFNDRVVVLDKNAPHPSGQARALVEAGVFTPVFYGNFRAFTIEASPEYIDIAYYLSPEALKKLKVNILLIDNVFFETLPKIRKQQLDDEAYFEKVFDYSNNRTEWEKIYKIKNEYLENGGELDGAFVELSLFLPTQGNIYIDNEENFDPSFLRRPLIFSLRDKEIYYSPQSGVYLNVETDINSHPPIKSGDYDYLVLGKNTNPENICDCLARLIWTGLKGEVFMWKRD